jgi:hypothetical protein
MSSQDRAAGNSPKQPRLSPYSSARSTGGFSWLSIDPTNPARHYHDRFNFRMPGIAGHNTIAK